MVAALLGIACGGSDGSMGADAAPPDVSEPLTIGAICTALTEVTCARDAECFDFFELPCDQSYYQFCCVDDRICDFVNGVNAEEVDRCTTALEQATCQEIDSDFPAECRGITSPDGLSPASSSNDLWMGGK
jgi:hypothetical protein